MAEDIDTSSYPKPAALPAQKSLLDQVGQYQNLQANQIGIDTNKLSLMNNQFQLLNNGVSTLIADPEVTGDNADPAKAAQKISSQAQYMAKQLNLPASLVQNFVNQFQIPSNATPAQIRDKLNGVIAQGQTHQEMINLHYGAPGTVNNNQTIQPVVSSPKPGFGVRSTGPAIQMQVPPTAPVVTRDNRPALQGPQLPVTPPGTVAAPPAAPGALPSGPVQSPAIRGQSNNFGGNVLGASVEPPTFNDRFNGTPTGPITGFAPGVAEAATAAGQGSGQQLAEARNRSAHFQRDIFPLAQAIPDLEKLGTTGTGPGTETINHLKSFILSNLPGINVDDPKFKAFAAVPTFDKAKKYLTDFVNQTGNTGTNDKLAASFAGNPSVGISNAAAVDVAKSAMALRLMDQAIQLDYEQSNIPENKYSSWIAKRTQELDPRAFGVDLMKPEAKKVLLNQLNKNPQEKRRFEKSLELAHNLGFVTPK